MNWKINILINLFVLLLPMVVSAQVLNGRFSSSFYAWEQYDTLGSSNFFVRGFQHAQLRFTKDDVSIQTSFYGATSLVNSFGDNGVVRVSNLFLRWKDIGSTVDVSLGRVPVFTGVGNGTVDGGLVKARVFEQTKCYSIRRSERETGFTFFRLHRCGQKLFPWRTNYRKHSQ